MVERGCVIAFSKNYFRHSGVASSLAFMRTISRSFYICIVSSYNLGDRSNGPSRYSSASFGAMLCIVQLISEKGRAYFNNFLIGLYQ